MSKSRPSGYSMGFGRRYIMYQKKVCYSRNGNLGHSSWRKRALVLIKQTINVVLLNFVFYSISAKLKQPNLQMEKDTPYPYYVFFILGNEFCERYAFYGMHAILVIFLVGSKTHFSTGHFWGFRNNFLASMTISPPFYTTRLLRCVTFSH